MSFLSNTQYRGTLLVVLSAALFGWIGYLGTQLFYEHFSVENMLFWRFFSATLWIAVSFLFVGKIKIANGHPCESRNLQNVTISNKKIFWRIFIFVTIFYSCSSALFFIATKYIGTGIAMVIFFSFPLFVALIAYLLGSWRFNKYAIAALVAVFSGLILLKGNGPFQLNTLGILLAVAAAFLYAIYVYGSKTNSQNMNTQILTFITCFGSTLFFLMWSSWDNTFVFPHHLQAWFYICAIGIFGTALPIQFLLIGLKNISPVKASILSVIEPVTTMVIGISLLGETISLQQSLGIIIVLLGAILIQFERLTEAY